MWDNIKERFEGLPQAAWLKIKDFFITDERKEPKVNEHQD